MAASSADMAALYTLVTNSMSKEESIRNSAEMTLSQSEGMPGFCSCLLELITSPDLESQFDVRLVASVYLKNTIIRYWRASNRRSLASSSSGIGNEEKIHLRKKLLSHWREQNNKIAQMLAFIISKIARVDYPKEWPELFPVLVQQLQSADVISSHRILMVLFRILKELSSKRLAADQRNFAEVVESLMLEQAIVCLIYEMALRKMVSHRISCIQKCHDSITSNFFDYGWRLWQNDVQTILHSFSTVSGNYNPYALKQPPNELYLTCERWLLCLKIIRQLIVSGFPSDGNSSLEIQSVKEVSPMLLNAVQSFLSYYSLFREKYPKFSDFIKKACVKLMKVLVSIQGRHPYSFGDKSVLLPVIDFCLTKITDPEPDVAAFEPFLIQCMVMVKCILECKEYKASVTGRVMDENRMTHEEIKKNKSSAVGALLSSFLTGERIVLLCNILIRRYFILTANDLEIWFQNPETFHHEQDMVQWTEKLRPSAEALFIVLFENHSQLLGPVVVAILQEAMNGCSSSETEITSGLLLKDAAYGAAAYVYYELSNYLSFKDWYNGALSLELSNNHSNARIIHRKVALILGQWVSEIKDETKRSVYCGLIRLLQDNDLSVRLAACRSLCLNVEDANFSERDFTDLLPMCWDSCFKLVDEVQEFDSKVQVLNVISVLIGHVTEVIPLSNKLVQFFQKLWEESSGESLLQIQILIALKNFVVALGYQSPICYNMLLPILDEGININSPDELNLLEDSILLWEATLSHAPALVPQVIAYFPRVAEIIERSFDHLQVAVSITESYVILGGSEFLNMHASTVAKILDLIVGNVNDKGLLSTLPVIDLLVQCFPTEVPPMIGSTLQKLIVVCLTGGDDLDPSKEAAKASSAAILARLLVMNTNYMAQLTSEQSLFIELQKAGIVVKENVLLCLVDLWLDKVDNVSSIQAKMYGLALSIIMTLRLPQVLDKLDLILSVCTSVILGGNDDLSNDASSSQSHGEANTPSKEFRRRQIKLSDPINSMSLESSVRENLQICAALHGESFNSAISLMHPSSFEQLKQAIKMT